MVKKTLTIAICISSVAIGYPIGLGKNYENRPPFFHHAFYHQSKNGPPSEYSHNQTKKHEDHTQHMTKEES